MDATYSPNSTRIIGKNDGSATAYSADSLRIGK